MQKHIVVIGGGVAGTGAAYSLRKRGYKVTVLEKNDYLGGRVRNEDADGAAIEMGAAFMTKSYKNTLAFLSESGLDAKLYRQRASSGILRGGKVKMATVSTLAGNGALSWRAKLRVIPLIFKVLISWRSIDMQAPWRAEKYDTQSVADTLRGKAGKELLEYVAQPILNGYFYWTPERTSFAILLVILKATLKGGTMRLTGGLQQIPEELAKDCEVLLSTTVRNVQKEEAGRYIVNAQHKDSELWLQADGIVCATTASIVSKILSDLSTNQKKFFDSISYSSTAVVAQTYNANQTRGDKGLAFPRVENSQLAAITVTPEKTNNGEVLGSVKAYASGSSEQLQSFSNEEIIHKLLEERTAYESVVLSPGAQATATYFQKWPEALPVFGHGHFHKLHLFADGEIEQPDSKLVFAGDYLGGPFIEGAFTSGLQAADRLNEQLQ